MNLVYGSPTACLGDCWAFISLMCDLSIRTGSIIQCSSYVAPRMDGQGFDPRNKTKSKLTEIMSLLDMGEARIELVDVGATIHTPDTTCFKVPYLPTKVRWQPSHHGVIAHQLTNSQEPANNPRCLKEHHLKGIMDWINVNSMGVRLGLPMSIKECVEAAATSDLFIGMDSGMSHVCHSVGVPVILYDWSRIDEFHHEKKFSRFNGSDEAITLMKKVMDQMPSP